MKIIITESQYNRAIDSYISYLLEPHEVQVSMRFSKDIFWVQNGKIIAQIENSDYLWLREEIWYSISRMFDFEELELLSAIKSWFKINYNIKLTVAGPLPDSYFKKYETILNLR